MESFRLKRKQLKDYGFVILGSLIMAFGIKNFFAPTGLVTGGFSGLTIVLNALL